MTQLNTRVLLARRPAEQLQASDFAVDAQPLAPLQANQFRIRNLYFSLDAGFRQWMNEGSDDNYLSSMPLGEPVQSIILGQVEESRHPQYPVGSVVVGRTAWEQFSVADGSDLMSIIEPDPEVPLHEYLCSLGPAGITAYFGLMEIGKPRAGDVFVINAAAGGVGAIAGQIARAQGCSTIGIAGGETKCRWLLDTLSYDKVIDYKSGAPLAEQLQLAAPDGADIVFDNVGGSMLGTLLGHLAENARVVLCGAISQYDKVDGHEGVANMWQLITKRARAEGFMFSDYTERYPEALDYLAGLLKADQLVSPVNISEGVESAGQAFVDMLEGNSLGKCLVKI
ncbi:NADP-dependent oxidoreductase [Pseudomaricurvus alcaniphilus]|uniref:MDR family NADP-dependent oxidoreductase n=1 Tax=Pseudomaricurvus alcaniphilus TaxID=1166482 RepID=UPI0014079F4F|nr:NADP-dependent oxidoreductase [Pseudomaricurvus alcaniphilus]NHN39257.1 NADP-dependent oxidoreductase [Pseudomaricurvus alcaniphilus]